MRSDHKSDDMLKNYENITANEGQWQKDDIFGSFYNGIRRSDVRTNKVSCKVKLGKRDVRCYLVGNFSFARWLAHHTVETCAQMFLEAGYQTNFFSGNKRSVIFGYRFPIWNVFGKPASSILRKPVSKL